jgi:GNAT superfamily N-acetyltransferase
LLAKKILHSSGVSHGSTSITGLASSATRWIVNADCVSGRVAIQMSWEALVRPGRVVRTVAIGTAALRESEPPAAGGEDHERREGSHLVSVSRMSFPAELAIRFATPADCATIVTFIRDLAESEKLTDQVVADEAAIRATVFGPRPAAEVLIAELAGAPVGFALFFQSYSTFLGKPGLYLEDLFVRPAARGKGVGRALMSALARITTERNWGRFEWSVLDWNEPAIKFYASLGATPQSDWIINRLVGAALAQLAQTWPHRVRS